MKLSYIPLVTALGITGAGAAAPAAQAQLTDAHVAHIAVTANQLDVTAAQQALE